MLSTAVGSGIRTALASGTPSGSDGDAFQPLGACSRSIFRLSRVSECLLTSNLAEVKLLLLSSRMVGGASAAEVSVKSLSSEDDLLRIEIGDYPHPETSKREQQERTWKVRR